MAPSTESINRSPSALHAEFVKTLATSDAVFDKLHQTKVILLEPSGGLGEFPPLRIFIAECIAEGIGNGVTTLPAPLGIGAIPGAINPSNLAKLHWADTKASNAEKSIIPLTCVTSVESAPEGFKISVHILDGSSEYWSQGFSLTRQELAALPAVPATNFKILQYAQTHLGQQVGNGECWTLADEALKDAGGKHPAVYVWGRPLIGNESIMPGDVIQFTSLRLEKAGSWIQLGVPVHTAIVERVKAPLIVVVLHQNFGQAGRKVSEATLDFSTKTSGQYVIFRPIPK